MISMVDVRFLLAKIFEGPFTFFKIPGGDYDAMKPNYGLISGHFSAPPSI